MPGTIIIPNKHLSRSLTNYRARHFPKGFQHFLSHSRSMAQHPYKRKDGYFLFLSHLIFFPSSSPPFTSVLPVLHPVLLFMETSKASIEQEIQGATSSPPLFVPKMEP
ncbi:hypothetical protein CEXT_336641 [Caerostris extrusa]|uniref:Uncharacterized protein n=1 Tax=Caerostris extrusa TaxID=172846 RepID=A0AAV4Y085_CAEEX|nr:hypothetical protein CEXT_336641 [Caerostris extrusa]